MNKHNINTYERRLAQSRLQQQALTHQQAISNQQMTLLKEQLGSQTKVVTEQLQLIKQIKEENVRLTKQIALYKGAIDQAEQRYGILHNALSSITQPMALDIKSLVDAFQLEKMLLQTKLQMQHNEIETLGYALENKNASISSLIVANNQLKMRELDIVRQYNESKQKMQTEIEQLKYRLNLKVQEAVPTIDNSSVRAQIVQAYEQIMKVKDEEIRNLRERVEEYRAQAHKHLKQIRELNEVYGQLPNTPRNMTYEQLLIENLTLKKRYESAKKDMDDLEREIPNLEEYRQRIEKLSANNDTLGKQQRLIQQLKRKLQESQKDNKIKAQYVLEENKRLRKKQDELTSKNCELQAILTKYSFAFKIMNPYFDIYKYEMVGLTKKEMEKINDIEKSKALSARINDFQAQKNRFEYMKNTQEQQSLQQQEEISNLKKQLKTYKDVMCKGFEQSQINSTEQSQTKKKCISIIKQLIEKMLRLQSDLEELKIKYDKLHQKYRNLQTVPQLHFIKSADCMTAMEPIYIQESVFLSGGQPTVKLTQIKTQIANQRDLIGSLENTIGQYRVHFEYMNSVMKILQNTLRQSKQLNAVLVEKVSRKEEEIANLKVGQPRQSEQIGQPIDKVQSMGHISQAELMEGESVSQESINHLTQIMDNHMRILSDVENQYSKLKVKYENSLKIISQQTHLETDKTTVQNNILKKRLQQASIKLQKAQQNQKTQQRKAELLSQENSRLMKCLENIEQSRTMQEELHRNKYQALMEEQNAGLKHREILPLKFYEQGHDSLTDSKVVQSLSNIISEKNGRIEYLQKKMGEMMQEWQKGDGQPKQLKLYVGVEQNLPELLDRAAKVIETLRSHS